MTSAHGPVVVRRRLGAALRELRAGKGYQLDVVAKYLEFSSAKLSRLEAGQVAPKVRDVRDLLEMYDAPDEVRQRLLSWASEAKEPMWWQPLSAEVPADLNLYISLEAEAATLKIYSIQVPGLLQTEGYARALLERAAPQTTADRLEELITIRLHRQAVVAQDRGEVPPLQLHVILDEAGLRRGRPDVMNDQLAELLRRAEWPHVQLQVFPFTAGHDEACSTFAIFEPREVGDWTVVNVESTAKDHYYDDLADVARYESLWDDLRSRSLSSDESWALIDKILGESTRA